MAAAPSDVRGCGRVCFQRGWRASHEAHISGPLKSGPGYAGQPVFFGRRPGAQGGPGGNYQTVAGGGSSQDNRKVCRPHRSHSEFRSASRSMHRGTSTVSGGYSGDRIFRISPEGLIYTVAGGGTLGLEADGGSARQARLLTPVGLVLDTKGNLYFCEQARSCVRKAAPDRTITTVAGTGTRGFSGDGGPASKAQLMSPVSLALDGGGNLLILDSGNASVRVVSPDGAIRSLVEPNPYAYVSSLALDGNGNLWITGPYGLDIVVSGTRHQVIADLRSSSSGDYGHSASETPISGPFGLTVDRYGLIYFTKQSWHNQSHRSSRDCIDSRKWLFQWPPGSGRAQFAAGSVHRSWRKPLDRRFRLSAARESFHSTIDGGRQWPIRLQR